MDQVEILKQRDPAAVRQLLDRLPDWFGIPESNDGYVAAAARMASYLARGNSSATLGVLLMQRHFPEAAEVHLMAVHPQFHRGGIGRQLLATAEADLQTDGVRLLQVKTLGPSHPHEGYQATRAFYRAMGFLPLEETDALWAPENPCLIMVKGVGSAST